MADRVALYVPHDAGLMEAIAMSTSQGRSFFLSGERNYSDSWVMAVLLSCGSASVRADTVLSACQPAFRTPKATATRITGMLSRAMPTNSYALGEAFLRLLAGSRFQRDADCAEALAASEVFQVDR